jgi:putative membrane protein
MLGRKVETRLFALPPRGTEFAKTTSPPHVAPKPMNIMKTKSLILSLTLALAAGALNLRANDDGDKGQLTRSDFKFACEVSEASSHEIEVGQLAAQKASDQRVREFGQKMVADHTKAATELQQLIAAKGAKLPEKSAREEKKEEKKKENLSELTGIEFDKAYMKKMVKGHAKMAKEFEKQAEKGDDQALKDWAAKTLATVKEHHRLAESIDNSLDKAKSTTEGGN